MQEFPNERLQKTEPTKNVLEVTLHDHITMEQQQIKQEKNWYGLLVDTKPEPPLGKYWWIDRNFSEDTERGVLQWPM